MKPVVLGIIPALSVALLLNGCGNLISTPTTKEPLTVQQSQQQPAKEILVTYGDYDKPHETLGPVEYILKVPPSSDAQTQYWDQAVDSLKRTAITQYGYKVDGIIDVELDESPEEKNGGENNIVHVQGKAISFKPGAPPLQKQKVRYKARYKSKHAKVVTSGKAKPVKKEPAPVHEEEVKISPSELLK